MNAITRLHSDPASAWLAQARIIAREALAPCEPARGPALVAALNLLDRSAAPADRRLRNAVIGHIGATRLRGLQNPGTTGGEAA